jgi:dCTP deaminase
MPTRICLYGPTGSGKTALATQLASRCGGQLMKIAEPLHALQSQFYDLLEKKVRGQDGEFLQFLAAKIESEKPNWLADQFLHRVQTSASSLIVNDDCRFNCYPALKKAGFVFIRVLTPPQIALDRAREDHRPVNPGHPVESGFDQFEAEYTVDNSGSVDRSVAALCEIVESLRSREGVHSHHGWLTGRQIWEEVTQKRIIIEPFDPACLNPNSYNYHLANRLRRITSEVIDCRKEDEYEEIEIGEEGFVLSPGECYLGATQEVFGSELFASLITGRSSVGRKFVTNHITAGLVDQGFLGTLTLEIVVHKPTRIYPGMVFGQIFWFTTCGLPYLYAGKYQSQEGPTLSRLAQDDALRRVPRPVLQK